MSEKDFSALRDSKYSATGIRIKPAPKTVLEKEVAKEKRERLENNLLYQMGVFNIPTATREYVFHESRKWRFDFCWPDRKIAVEVEGGTTWGKSRHSFGKGFDDDSVKYNTATLAGWKVYRFSKTMIESGDAIAFIERIFNGS